MKYRIATIEDFLAIHQIRMSVHENRLSDPSKVTESDYRSMIQERGRGWVCESKGEIVGFCIVGTHEKNVWALFLLQDFERKGIGFQLQKRMLEWYFSQGFNYLWLSTEPGTRAEKFYEKTGWKKIGLLPNGEIKFERSGV